MSTIVAATLSNGTVSTSTANCIQGSAKAWVNFVGSSGSINASYNVSSVTRNSTGYYTINFTTAMPNINYVAVIPALTNAANNTLLTAKPFLNTSGVYTAPTTSSFVLNLSTPVTGAMNDGYTMVGVAVFSS